MRRLVLALILIGAPVFAVQPDEMLGDPALEARAREISAGLRCPVCRNELIDESNAGVARDLRLMVRERLAAGDSDDEVVAAVVARYGEFVLLTPRRDGREPGAVAGTGRTGPGGPGDRRGCDPAARGGRARARPFGRRARPPRRDPAAVTSGSAFAPASHS